jgi:hypothetical protein
MLGNLERKRGWLHRFMQPPSYLIQLNLFEFKSIIQLFSVTITFVMHSFTFSFIYFAIFVAIHF